MGEKILPSLPHPPPPRKKRACPCLTISLTLYLWIVCAALCVLILSKVSCMRPSIDVDNISVFPWSFCWVVHYWHPLVCPLPSMLCCIPDCVPYFKPAKRAMLVSKDNASISNFHLLKMIWFCYNKHCPQTPPWVCTGLVFNGLIFNLARTVVAQWIRPRTLNREVPSSNLLASAVVPLGKALYLHCLVPQKGLKAIGPLVACL